mgnify:CR=1 FL=1
MSDLGKLLKAQRAPDETYEAYKFRRKAGQTKVKEYLQQGTMFYSPYRKDEKGNQLKSVSYRKENQLKSVSYRKETTNE